MATLFIAEFAEQPLDIEGHVLPTGRFGTTQTVNIGASSTQSSAVGADTRYVRLASDADCHFAIASNPTATTSSPPLFSKLPEYFGVLGSDKIAVIQT